MPKYLTNALMEYILAMGSTEKDKDNQMLKNIKAVLKMDEIASQETNDPELGISMTVSKFVDLKEHKMCQADEQLDIFQIAVLKSQYEVLKYLINKDKNIIAYEEKMKYPPLWLAASYNNVKMVKFLIDHGANPACISKNLKFTSPIHCAVSLDNGRELLQLLLLNGVSPNQQNTNYSSPYTMVSNPKIKKLLESAESLQKAITLHQTMMSNTNNGNSTNFFEMKSLLDKALEEDFEFVTEYLAKVASTVNDARASKEVDQDYYKPNFLRIALKTFKEFFKMGFHMETNTIKTVENLTMHLEGYDLDEQNLSNIKSQESLADKVFLSLKEKNGIVRALQKGSSVEETKKNMENLKATGSPIHNNNNSNTEEKKVFSTDKEISAANQALK